MVVGSGNSPIGKVVTGGAAVVGGIVVGIVVDGCVVVVGAWVVVVGAWVVVVGAWVVVVGAEAEAKGKTPAPATLSIHVLKFETRAYTPGYRPTAHPYPHDTTPTSTRVLGSVRWAAKSGPPESPWQESLPEAAAHTIVA